MADAKTVAVAGAFDDFRSRHVRLLEEAAKLGDVHVLLWSDESVRALTGRGPNFPQAERKYLLEACRYVKAVRLVSDQIDGDALPQAGELKPEIWVVEEEEDNSSKRTTAVSLGIEYHVFKNEALSCFPGLPFDPQNMRSSRKRVIVTGCFDWFHSGHVRFFEEVSELGDLYVVVGHDKNIKLLKGEGHPMFSQDERRYMVESVRFVRQALVSSGRGWMDAEPEIALIKPHIYVVNKDGDVPEKRVFCKEHGIKYVVLTRTPKQGLPKRQSTLLRGF